MDGTDSGSCAMAGFGINGVEPSGSAASVLATKSIRYLFGC